MPAVGQVTGAAAALLVGVALMAAAPDAAALNTGDPSHAELRQQIREKMRGLYPTRPGRREKPLRDLNLNDIEVREIESQTRALLPGAVVNIGAVAQGCPCQEGHKCEGQVWVVASTPTSSRGLLLSRIQRHWVTGPLQEWWLRYEALFAAQANRSIQRDEALNQLIKDFPQCQARPMLEQAGQAVWPE